MAQATEDDVRGVIKTDLTDPEIQNYLDDAAFEAQEAIDNYSTALTTEQKSQLEKYLASLLIREYRDKAIKSTSRETASVSYEGPTLGALKKAVDKRDPSNSLAHNTDTDRYVTRTGK